jgi:hypothetical protein
MNNKLERMLKEAVVSKLELGLLSWCMPEGTEENNAYIPANICTSCWLIKFAVSVCVFKF